MTHHQASDLYGGKDPREIAIYTIPEAAKCLRMRPTTLRQWVKGRTFERVDGTRAFSEPLIERPSQDDPRISFNNLVEAHVLRALRGRHNVSMPAVRRALDFAQAKCGIDRLLLSPELRAAPGELFLKQYGKLISLDPAGQFAIEKVLESFLERVVRDEAGWPATLYPFIGDEFRSAQSSVLVDPRISFGTPVLKSKGIRTSFLAELVSAGESLDDISEYYGIAREELEEAILYERAA